MSRVLVIGDLHLPAERPDYLEFCKSLKKKYRTDTTVFIGDVIDHHSISFHNKHPEEDAAVAEYHRVQEAMKVWKKTFNKAMVCIGNHDERIQRLGASVGIPSMYMKPYKEIYDTPNWEWEYNHIIDNVMYTHGTGHSSAAIVPALNTAKSSMISIVSGHIHSAAAIAWAKGPNNSKLFGFNVPNGVDETHKMMYYGKNFLRKPINGAGVVIDGKPYMEIMD
tara:strand:+ start:1196 stop:1861 length:666 start_codon:yes stop_codon:yes gene_type:complete